jgi:hypothetical protein
MASFEAAKSNGMSHVPTIPLDYLSEDQIRAYVVADNRLAELADWDNSKLAIELQHLISLDCADLDVCVTGFDVAEIDVILAEGNHADDTEEPVPETVSRRMLSRPFPR